MLTHAYTLAQNTICPHMDERAACALPSGALVLHSPYDEERPNPNVWVQAAQTWRVTWYSERSLMWLLFFNFYYSLSLLAPERVCSWTCLHQGVFFTCLQACKCCFACVARWSLVPQDFLSGLAKPHLKKMITPSPCVCVWQLQHTTAHLCALIAVRNAFCWRWCVCVCAQIWELIVNQFIFLSIISFQDKEFFGCVLQGFPCWK